MKTIFNPDELKPSFNENSVNIFLSITPQWAIYSKVLITSIIKHSDNNKNYDIIILEENINNKIKDSFKKYLRKNISIRFFNLSEFLKTTILTTNQNLTKAAFYRIFAPIIFKNYKKILYVDTDTILKKDISLIFDEDVSNHHMGAIKDIGIINVNYKKQKEYFDKYCEIEDINKYFNSGVLLFNIEYLLKTTPDIVKEYLNIAKRKYWEYADQCVLNIYYNQNIQPIKFLNCKNNYICSKEIYQELNKEKYNEYRKNFKDAILIHYITPNKPWNKPRNCPHNLTWWKYAFFSKTFFQILKSYLFQPFKKIYVLISLCHI